MVNFLRDPNKFQILRIRGSCGVFDDELFFSNAMFTMYRIGFYSVSKVSPVQCKQGLMFCCGAEIVLKHS